MYSIPPPPSHLSNILYTTLKFLYSNRLDTKGLELHLILCAVCVQLFLYVRGLEPGGKLRGRGAEEGKKRMGKTKRKDVGLDGCSGAVVDRSRCWAGLGGTVWHTALCSEDRGNMSPKQNSSYTKNSLCKIHNVGLNTAIKWLNCVQNKCKCVLSHIYESSSSLVISNVKIKWKIQTGVT